MPRAGIIGTINWAGYSPPMCTRQVPGSLFWYAAGKLPVSGLKGEGHRP